MNLPTNTECIPKSNGLEICLHVNEFMVSVLIISEDNQK